MDIVVADMFDEWRKEAYQFSSAPDRMGIVISRAFEMLIVIARNGIGAENLKFAVDSLRWERNLAVNPASDGENTLRTHVFRLCEAMELTIESVIDCRGKEAPVDAAKKPASAHIAVDILQGAPLKLEECLFKDIDIKEELYDPDLDETEQWDDLRNDDDYEQTIRDVASGSKTGTNLKNDDIYEQTLREIATSSSAKTTSHSTPTASNGQSRSGRSLVVSHRFSPPAPSSRSPAASTSSSYVTKEQVDALTAEIKTRKIFKCDVCEKVFTCMRNLKYHGVAHLDETDPEQAAMKRPFKCDVCGLPFRTERTLTSHMSFHTGNFLLKCEICDAGFNSHASISRHMKCHEKGTLKYSQRYKKRTMLKYNSLAEERLKETGSDSPNLNSSELQLDEVESDGNE